MKGDDVEKCSERIVNENGKRLIQLFTENQLKSLNDYVHHKEIHKYTWVKPTTNLKTIIDYVITKQKTKLLYSDVRVYRVSSCGSDRHFLNTTITAPIRRQHRIDGE